MSVSTGNMKRKLHFNFDTYWLLSCAHARSRAWQVQVHIAIPYYLWSV